MWTSATECCLQAGHLTHALPVPRTSISVAIVPEARVWNLYFSFSRLWARRSEEGAQPGLSSGVELGSLGGLPLPLCGPSQTSLSVPSLLHPEPFLGIVVPLALLSWNVLHSATSFPASLPFFVPRDCVGFSMDHIGCQDGIRYASLVLGEGL